MIRVALVAVSFLVVTITLIMLQPHGPAIQSVQAPLQQTAAVTRADTGFDTLTNITATIARSSEPGENEARTTTTPEPQTPSVENRPAELTDGLENLIVKALRQGQSEGYIDALVNDAAKRGQVDVPSSLLTADGRVDTTTLLTALTVASNAPRAGKDVYIVQAGDSLASISFRFYGSTARAPDIFAANSELMGAPSNIAVGQELVIPAP